MSLVIENREIRRVRLIDDKPQSRQVLGYPVEELQLDCVYEDGPILDIDTYVNNFDVDHDAAICDHHLREAQGYSKYNGAEVVNRLVKAGAPAILCTRYGAALLFEDIRKYRQHIPVLINPNELEPGKIELGFKLCIREIRGEIAPSRRTWRTLIRVADVDEQINANRPFVDLVIPAWDRNQIIRLLKEDIGDSVREKVTQGFRCHARVNIGAERQEDIFFAGWEE